MPKATLKSDSLALLIDEYGVLKEALAAVEDKRQRAEVVRGLILVKVGAFPDADAKTVEGVSHSCLITPRKMENEVNVSKAYKRLGPLQFLAVCKVSLTALKNLIPGNEAAKFVESTQTGPRVLTVTRKADLSV